MGVFERIKQYAPLAAAFAAFGGVVFLSGSKSLCVIRTFTGLPCPGCGLTTAGLALLDLKFQQAWQASPFIFFIPLLILIAADDMRPGKKRSGCDWHRIFYIVFAAALIGFYIYRMITFFPHGPYPMEWHRDNVICKVLELFNLRLF